MKKKGRKRVRTTADRRRVAQLDRQARKIRKERRKDGQNGQQSSKQQSNG